MNHHSNLSQQLNQKKNKNNQTYEKTVGRVSIICIFSLSFGHLVSKHPLIFIRISIGLPVRELHSHLSETHARIVRSPRAPSSGDVQSIAL